MKKVYSVIIALVLIVGVFSTIAYAQSSSHEKIDLTEYSLEELIELHEDVRAELADRLHLREENIIGRGRYVVGVDIKAGTYVLTVKETKTDGNGNPTNSIKLFDVLEDGRTELFWINEDIPIGEHAIVSLADGQLICISCVCYLSVDVPNWAP